MIFPKTKTPLLEMKTTRSEMKNTLHEVSILNIAKEKVTKCEDLATITIQSKTEKRELF